MATTSVMEPGMRGGILYDERNRPYILNSDGSRNYISPAAFGEPVPEDTTGIFRQAPQWDNKSGEWETPIDWTNIANMATIGGLTAGGANMLMAGAPAAGGGGAAASAAGPSAAAEIAAIDSAVAGMTPAAAGGTTAAVAGGEATRRMIDAASNPAELITPGYNMTPDIAGVTYDNAGNVVQGSSGIGRFADAIKDYFTGKGDGELIDRLLGAGGAAFGAASGAMANNRGQTLQALEQQEQLRQQGRNLYESQLMNRQDNERRSIDDAFIKAIQSQRVMNAQGYKPPSISQRPGAAPTPLANFGTGMAAPSADMKASAATMYGRAQNTLQNGPSLPELPSYEPYTADPELLKASGGERIAGWLGPALTAFQPPVPQPVRDEQARTRGR